MVNFFSTTLAAARMAREASNITTVKIILIFSPNETMDFVGRLGSLRPGSVAFGSESPFK